MYNFYRYVGPNPVRIVGDIFRHNTSNGDIHTYRPDMAEFNDGSPWDECFFTTKDMNEDEFKPISHEDIFTELI